MRNIKLVLEYDGSRYDGWQKQPGNNKSLTIQEKLESVLEKMEGEPVTVIGAARTEAGVHAYAQIANFKTNTDMKLYEIKHYLNRFLPRDIAVVEVAEVPERFHSSFSAKAFRFEYKITMGEVPSVFERKYNYYSFHKLDILKMRKGAAYLIGSHDFKAFSDNKRMKKSTERNINKIDIYSDINEIVITIEADDFWPNMARIIVGTLIEIGEGIKEADLMKDILQSKDREQAGETAEAKGLFLQEVLYQ
ncbi:tRNA pseudouridine synthase A [Anaerocolumna cellulosilytica]|uniref:tRNA pseudouridine synthase A n=1 Tax=Anaerocolumna cellulosilytica TaxID=433286 RepID=A0A6S6QZW3_9FIRM|nr:tRNA pseudouridine(38-40) synthase TruA [Anaerocolumna cellulosilytica]MBB5194199.1 tRNA pseudouridine38-40 synthase [Anaerocolumna cellulosilytica]BCJ94589.1 tRNA pseudouridine synthase A [Anaerocolumna cellulosilytica]